MLDPAGDWAIGKLLDALLGLSNAATKFAQNKFALRRWAALRDPKLGEWIRRYYAEKPDSRLLNFRDNKDGRHRTFPYLTRQAWLPGTAPTINLEVSFDSKQISGQEIDKNFITRQQLLGRRLEDNNCYALVDNDETATAINLTFGLCTYYQYVSICNRVANETTTQYLRGTKAKTPYRDRFASSLPEILGSRDGARATGVVVAVAFRDSSDSEWRVVLQERSNKVVGSEGMLMPLPGFAFQPTVKSYEGRECDLRHNFLRELCEEYYGQVELQDYTGRIDPAWFYKYEPVREFVQDPSTLDFDVVGMGVDGINGEPTIACAATIHSDEFLKDGTVKKNWESKHTEAVRLDAESISDLIFTKNITGLGALAIMGLLRQKNEEAFSRFTVSAT